ncbi:MAG TPA: diguanylate cyclase [Thermodesulfovibrionales bacterium]|nr:diguanylate cyclase [Thermodesulfovibrionales bacterium]
MKREIFIYDDDREVLKFLKSFFRGRNDYTARFINKKGEEGLKRELEKKKPAALIIGSPNALECIKPSESEFPVIVLISPGNTINGIRSVVKSGVEYYLLAPFYKEDLEDRLRVAIKRKSWLETLHKENKDLEALIELTHFITSTLDPRKALYLVVKKLSEIIHVTRCSIISIDAKDKRYANVVSTFEDPNITNIRLDLQKYPEIRKALSLKKSVLVKDALKDPMMEEVKDIIEPMGIRSIMVIPVIFHDEVIGTLLLNIAKAERTFSERERKLCTAIASASANTLYNAFLYDNLAREKRDLERLAITDYLTGIYNVRYFYNRLDEEFSRAERHRMPLCCMMFDIDNFKKINDTYGHRVGDIILREFAQLVKEHTRKSDIFARYGGEEFIMLLPQTSLSGSLAEAERLSKIVKKYQFYALKDGEKITVSVGIACSSDTRIKNPDNLITFADDALFTAKKKGRDQIAINPSL